MAEATSESGILRHDGCNGAIATSVEDGDPDREEFFAHWKCLSCGETRLVYHRRRKDSQWDMIDATALAQKIKLHYDLAEIAEESSYIAGWLAGCSWSWERASRKPLQRLARLAEEFDWDAKAMVYDIFDDDESGGRSCGLYFILTAREPDDAIPSDVDVFWERVLGEDASRIEDEEFAVGFVTGALEDLYKAMHG